MAVSVQSKVEKAVVVTSTGATSFVTKVEVGPPTKTVTSGERTINNLNGVSTTGAVNGAFLMFDSAQNLWTAQTDISSSNTKINGGNF